MWGKSHASLLIDNHAVGLGCFHGSLLEHDESQQTFRTHARPVVVPDIVMPNQFFPFKLRSFFCLVSVKQLGSAIRVNAYA